jgi:hypothetical protein
MTTKAPSISLRAGGLAAVEVDERHQDQVDAFVVRNRDALNESIHASRDEMRKGITATRTIDQIISDGHKRNIAG